MRYCDVDVVVTLRAIGIDDLLPRLGQRGFVDRLVDLQLDPFAERFGRQARRAFDLDLVDDRARLHRDDHFHAFALRLAEDADVLDLAGLVEVADVLLDDRLRIILADRGAHLREDAIAADRLRPGVLDLNRADLYAFALLGVSR